MRAKGADALSALDVRRAGELKRRSRWRGADGREGPSRPTARQPRRQAGQAGRAAQTGGAGKAGRAVHGGRAAMVKGIKFGRGSSPCRRERGITGPAPPVRERADASVVAARSVGAAGYRQHALGRQAQPTGFCAPAGGAAQGGGRRVGVARRRGASAGGPAASPGPGGCTWSGAGDAVRATRATASRTGFPPSPSAPRTRAPQPSAELAVRRRGAPDGRPRRHPRPLDSSAFTLDAGPHPHTGRFPPPLRVPLARPTLKRTPGPPLAIASSQAPSAAGRWGGPAADQGPPPLIGPSLASRSVDLFLSLRGFAAAAAAGPSLPGLPPALPARCFPPLPACPPSRCAAQGPKYRVLAGTGCCVAGPRRAPTAAPLRPVRR